MKKLWVLGGSVFTLLTIMGVAFLSTPQNQKVQHVVSIDPSYVGGGSTISQLMNGPIKTTVIAQGSFVGSKPASPVNGIPFTDFSFKIDKILYGKTTSSIVTIHQTGGHIVKNGESLLMQASEDPLFKVGSHYILALHQYSPGKYFVIGGPAGRFELTNGKVKSFNPSKLGNNESLSQFTNSIIKKTTSAK